MKKLVIINLILILLIFKIPLKNENSQKLDESNYSQKTENTISSRSIEQPRLEQLEPQIILAVEISQDCIDLVKQSEGFKDKAYLLDGEKYYTIGYGHSGPDVKSSQVITQEEAHRLLFADLKGYANAVLKYCEYLELKQNELDALVSFTYNCGLGNLHKLTGYQTRTKEEIGQKILNYTKSSNEANRKGLLKRRLAEQKLFLGK